MAYIVTKPIAKVILELREQMGLAPKEEQGSEMTVVESDQHLKEIYEKLQLILTTVERLEKLIPPQEVQPEFLN